MESPNTALLNACKTMDVDGVRKALEQGADINAEFNLGTMTNINLLDLTVCMCFFHGYPTDQCLEIIGLLMQHGVKSNLSDVTHVSLQLYNRDLYGKICCALNI